MTVAGRVSIAREAQWRNTACCFHFPVTALLALLVKEINLPEYFPSPLTK